MSRLAPWTLLTFASGRFLNARNRFIRQAVAMDAFDAQIVVTAESLDRIVPGFTQEHGDFLRKNQTKGFGYWLWKPAIIQAVLQAIPPSSGLLYCDIGCEFNSTDTAKTRLSELMEVALESGLLATHLGNDFPEWQWSKKALTDSLDLTDSDLNGPLIQGGVLFLKRVPTTIELVSEWMSIASCNSYSFLDDSPSPSPERVGFRRHSHDQAILSGLVKSYGLPSVEFPRHPLYSMRERRANPIMATRNCGRLSSGGITGIVRLSNYVAKRSSMLPI